MIHYDPQRQKIDIRPAHAHSLISSSPGEFYIAKDAKFIHADNKDWSDRAITKTRLFKYIENFNSKNWKFSDKKNSDIFQISTQNIDCGYSLEPPRRGGSNEYSQSMVLSRNKKNNVYPCKP